MTITTTTARNDYTGAGSTGPYAYTFRIFAATDLLVVTRNTSTGVEIPLAYVTDYSVTGVGEGAGGTVTLTSALAVGYTMAITRVVPIVQDTDLRNQGTFYPQTYEDALDYLTAIDQQQEDAIERSFKLGDAINPATFDTAVDTALAGTYLRVNLAGTGVEFAAGSINTSTYTASGTGAVTRTVTSKLGDMISVKDYGATGDGVTSDVAAINAAMVAANGRRIWFPGGTYLIDAPLTTTGLGAVAFEGERTERAGTTPTVMLKYRPASTVTMFSLTVTNNPADVVGPFEFRNIDFDAQSSFDPTLFQFGDETLPIATYRRTFCVQFEDVRLIGNTANPVSSASGVLTRTSQFLVKLAKCDEFLMQNVRLMGGDVQVRMVSCDKPTFRGVRSLYSNQAFDIIGADALTVQHTFEDVQVEGWTFMPMRVTDCEVTATNMRFENNNSSVTGMGWFVLPAVTVACTKGSNTLTFSTAMTNILFPGLSVILLKSGTNSFLALVKTVNGVTVTFDNTCNFLPWTAAAATVTRLHGFGPMVNSTSWDSTFANISIVGASNAPAFAYIVNGGSLFVANAAQEYGAASGVQASLAIGNKFAGLNYLNGQVTFSGCSPYLVADPTSPFVTVSNVRSPYGSIPHPIAGAGTIAWSGSKRSRMGDLGYERTLTRRVWAWSPKSYTENGDSAPYALNLSQLPVSNTLENIWAWDFRTDTFFSTLVISDESLPYATTVPLRVAFKVKGINNTAQFKFQYCSGAPVLNVSATNTTVLSGDWQVLEFILQAVPAQWTGGLRGTTQTGFKILTAATDEFYLAAVTVEELPASNLVGVSALVDAATIATDASLGGTFTVTLGGNRTMGAPTNPQAGQRIEYLVTQDGTGGRTLAWNAVFKQSWSDTGNTTGKQGSIAFRYDGSNWRQVGAQGAYF